jgi:RNA polymerase sigma-70 factor (ECF subfamily)
MANAAEEIVQDVFLALWKKRADLTIQSLPVYLAAMTRYTVYRTLARQNKYSQVSISEAEATPASDTDIMDNKLLLEIIEKLSARLPEKCRMVFVRNKLLDQPLDQVAEDMNISIKTAEAHLTKSLKIIRKNLGDSLSVLFL